MSVEPAESSSPSAPLLSGAGGGIFFWWQLGMQCFKPGSHCALASAAARSTHDLMLPLITFHR